ncbi:MAG: molybdenum cofactor guanylyltransferase [Roseivirga sp.]|nr:molybdenum cofactor guanylyltransferase [Roseivirga sp.]
MAFSDLWWYVNYLSIINCLCSFQGMAYTGIILAGGKSLRMGEDKGLVRLNNKPLISYAIDALRPLVSELLIVANGPGYEPFGYPVIPDLIPESGPLGGTVTGLTDSNSEWNLVLSCDTPFVSTKLFEHLLSNVNNYQAVLPRHKGELEPLTGLYNKNCLKQLEEFIADRQLKMRWAVQQLNLKEVIIDSQNSFYEDQLFQNINTREALLSAEKKLAES